MTTTPKITIEELRAGIVRAAQAAWTRHIRDTQPGYKGDVETLTNMIRQSGAEWLLRGGLYDESKAMMWCGIFPAYCGAIVGDHIREGVCLDVRMKPGIGKYILPSTMRPESAAKWKEAGTARFTRITDPQQLQAGDLVTIYGGRKDEPWGDHWTIATGAPQDGWYPSIEGNAYGLLGDGKSWGEGVIVRDTRTLGAKYPPRTLAQIRRIWRLELHHFEGSALA
jgi:hypothetical protein